MKTKKTIDLTEFSGYMRTILEATMTELSQSYNLTDIHINVIVSNDNGFILLSSREDSQATLMFFDEVVRRLRNEINSKDDSEFDIKH